MRTIILITVLTISLYRVGGDHLVIGNTANRVVLTEHKKVEYNAIPFIKRIKYFFYTSPNNKMIQGIQALDELHSKASINVTAGGVGHPFVNLRMKSERGRGLEYDIGIYENSEYLQL